MRREEIIKLLKKLEFDYYQRGVKTLPDHIYDELLAVANTKEKVNESFGTKGKFYHLSEIKRISKLSPQSSKVEEILSKDHLAEAKLDGVFINCIFSGGKLFKVLTRGNLMYGDDVTEITSQIVPKEIDLKHEIEIQGELVIRKNKVPEGYIDGRHACSGFLGRKDKTDFCPEMFVHSFGLGTLHLTREEKYDLAKRNGFQLAPMLSPSEKIEKYFEQLKDIHFQCDGVVIKLDLEQFAVKVPGETILAKTIDIRFTTGRTGKSTPILHLETKEKLGGKLIKRVSGYSIDFLRKKGIGIGSLVEIENTGMSIPVVKRCLVAGTSFGLVCEGCQLQLCVSEDEKSSRCINEQCPFILRNRLLFFCELQQTYGISKSFIEQVVELGLVKNLRDLILLNEECLLKLKGFKEKKIKAAMQEIEKLKRITKVNLLRFALGDSFGEKTCQTLATKVGQGFNLSRVLMIIKEFGFNIKQKRLLKQNIGTIEKRLGELFKILVID